jgi:hypothetical protein
MKNYLSKLFIVGCATTLSLSSRAESFFSCTNPSNTERVNVLLNHAHRPWLIYFPNTKEEITAENFKFLNNLILAPRQNGSTVVADGRFNEKSLGIASLFLFDKNGVPTDTLSCNAPI